MSKPMMLTLVLIWSLSIWSILVMREIQRIDLQATILMEQINTQDSE